MSVEKISRQVGQLLVEQQLLELAAVVEHDAGALDVLHADAGVALELVAASFVVLVYGIVRRSDAVQNVIARLPPQLLAYESTRGSTCVC